MHIVLLLLIAVSVGVIIATGSDFTRYGNFVQAREGGWRSMQVVGYLVKEQPVLYDPVKDPNYLGFTMVDKEGNEQFVYYKGAKPQDFERSEQVVVKGKMEADKFHASEILVKCPSKYVNDDIVLKEKAS